MRKRELIAKCERLETQIRERGLATDSELAEYRPPHGQRSSDWEWTWWYAQLVRFCGRLETHDSERSAADALVIAALRADPKEVRLLDPSPLTAIGRWYLDQLYTVFPGLTLQDRATVEAVFRAQLDGPAPAPSSVWVFPKSFETLLHIHARDDRITWLASRLVACRQTLNPADTLALVDPVTAELHYQQQVVAWIATTPGLGMPFDVEYGQPKPPAAIHDLRSWDLVRIHQAFMQVNVTDLQALDKLIQPTRTEQGMGRPSWSVFIDAMALKWKVDPRRLMRDYALVQLLATAKIASMTGAGADLEEQIA